MFLVSIIIPVYNREDTLPRLFDSLRAVDYRPLEIIFVDNASKDNSRALCEQFCKDYSDANIAADAPLDASNDAVALLLDCPKAGACAARNVGLAAARGEYCCFFDSDDEFSADFIPSMLESIGDADVCLARTRLFFPDGSSRVRAGWKNPTIYDHLLALNISTQTFLVKTEYIRAIGGWHEDLMIWQDYELGLRLLSGQCILCQGSANLNVEKPRLAWNKKVFHRIYQHPESITGMSFSDSFDNIKDALEVILAEAFALFDKKATCALIYRVAILRGRLMIEGNPDLAKRLPLDIRNFWPMFLVWYVSHGGRGGWRLGRFALHFIRS